MYPRNGTLKKAGSRNEPLTSSPIYFWTSDAPVYQTGIFQDVGCRRYRTSQHGMVVTYRFGTKEGRCDTVLNFIQENKYRHHP